MLCSINCTGVILRVPACIATGVIRKPAASNIGNTTVVAIGIVLPVAPSKKNNGLSLKPPSSCLPLTIMPACRNAGTPACRHVVFTLPHELNGLIMGNRKAMFDLLFQAAAHTLLTLGKDEKYLGAETGFTSILHTWGQDLSFHPHIHCIVSAGGIKEGKWIKEKRSNNKFIFPQGSMQKIFKGYFMEHLWKLNRQKLLQVEESVFQNLLSTIGYKKWNVYAKSPFGGPAQVVAYLGRYTHKIAITRHRLVEVTDTHIQFRYKDYADGNTVKEMTLTHQEFLRRFEQHILPRRFVKIRSYGYLKNCGKTARLQALRKSMNIAPMPPKVMVSVRQRILEKYGKDISICPSCNKGIMVLMETIRPRSSQQITLPLPAVNNKADPILNA